MDKTSTAQVLTTEPLSFLDVVGLVRRRWRLTSTVVFGVAALTSAATFLMPNVYLATVTVLPPQQQQSTAYLMVGQISGLAGLGPSALGLKNPSDLYVGMLQSRTIADALIQRFKLQDVYDTSTMVQTRRELAGNTSVYSGKEGLVFVEVEDRDPARAALLANAYIEELQSLTRSLAVTEAGQRRLFFEHQLVDAKRQLAEAEIALKTTQESTGLISLDHQGRAIIESAARLRAQIATTEVDLKAMGAFAADQNPEKVRVEQQLIALKSQLAKLETAERSANSTLVSTARVPQAGLEYIRRLRDVKYYETILELLAKQFEIAKIDEAKDAAIIQVVDPAVPPDRKHKPRRALIVVTAAFLALVTAIMALMVSERMRRASKLSAPSA